MDTKTFEEKVELIISEIKRPLTQDEVMIISIIGMDNENSVRNLVNKVQEIEKKVFRTAIQKGE
jgi:hypothetical protein